MARPGTPILASVSWLASAFYVPFTEREAIRTIGAGQNA